MDVLQVEAATYARRGSGEARNEPTGLVAQPPPRAASWRRMHEALEQLPQVFREAVANFVEGFSGEGVAGPRDGDGQPAAGEAADAAPRLVPVPMPVTARPARLSRFWPPLL